MSESGMTFPEWVGEPEPGPFKPTWHYDPDGDIAEAFWSDESCHAEIVAPGLVLYRGRETGAVVGVCIEGLAGPIRPPGDAAGIEGEGQR